MGIPRFIKLPRNNQFHYEPRYWDPVKEAREERIRGIKRELGIEVPDSPNRTTLKRGAFRQAHTQTRVKASRAANLRLIVILAVLFLIAYFLFYA
ncbi:MAG: hypothetical protein CSA96_02180 [Bacteroidetes bacterium]|nr:MAG: hypothetical protein CSA96_02180 [Bacteroidota bacterium]